MSDLETVLQFITAIEQKHPSQSAYEIANRLRGYTKSSYTTKFWTIATGFEQAFIDGTLNRDLLVAGEVMDFGHFIASLSDQVNQPGLQWSDFTRWTADHTAWAGDVGSSIATYRAQPQKFKSLQDALDRFASDCDYVADVAAFCVGAKLNANPDLSVSQAIRDYHASPYANQVRNFLSKRFVGIIESDRLTNPAKIEADIRNAVFTYLELSPDSGILHRVKKFFSQKLKLESDNARELLSADLLQGSLHFMNHLVKKGNLAPLTFKPYQMPQAPWLGTVNYEVTTG